MGLVATALLQARRRFAAPAVAPLVNNLVVIGAYLLFASLRGDQPPSLSLSSAEVAVLAGGTTLGVIAFTAVPVLAAARTGVRWRPRLARDAEVARLARQGAWAGAYLGLTQLLTLGVLVLGNGVGRLGRPLHLRVGVLPAALRPDRGAGGHRPLSRHGQRGAGPSLRAAGAAGRRRHRHHRRRPGAGQRGAAGPGVAAGAADASSARRPRARWPRSCTRWPPSRPG